ncbi:MAG: cyclically-permuted mutarotase family protein, partial [Paramuribaculum sp.]|nr:cyclically-permuted mutarotase family protein [Paramuribaculum sp.]
MKFLKNRHLVYAAILALCAVLPTQARVKVACIGNSITYGMCLESPGTQSYPAQLQQMLGDTYEVRNFGHSGAAVLRNGHHPYTDTPEYKAALAYKADIAVIHLGVNDTDPRSWPNFSHEFTSDYLYIIQQLRNSNPDIRIIVAKLTPLRATHPRFCSGTRIWRLEAQDFIERIASESNVELIDFNEPLVFRQDLLHDGVHPNFEGATLLAKEAYKGITGQYGPLSMPKVYSSGMVLPHSRYITLQGNANAHSPVSLSVNGHTYRTIASNRGEWNITIPPLTPRHEYEITVSDGTDTIRLSKILAGVVFLASGQSNMAFTLAEDINARQAIESSTDSLLRFFSMTPRFYTGDFAWTEQQTDSVNKLEYFQSSPWQSVNTANAPALSAVAYYFARDLRDALDMPVGIIQNAVGGATTSSWIDINTLEQAMPQILLNWRSNDYVQPWAQSRATRNSGPNSRHPYEPSYLFSSGIAPLGHYPLNGVIWYQGESNAHNIEVHHDLFKALTQSWRNYFRNHELPIYFAQLSSINRPSWPSFRNSQRLLASEIPNTAMAVTSDCGDSLDVHPRNKMPVGKRLARLALKHSFNLPINAHGPEPVNAEIVPEGIKISFNHANGLSVSHGTEPITFETAGRNRVFTPAKAKIINDHIILFDMETPHPRFVRYGWQPFTRANLINSDSLPASTFEIEVDNAPIYAMEQGIEAGLSGCFAAPANSRLVIAGGCNFPGDPFAPGATKKFYKGIYTADTAQMLWQLAGELPEPMAYGATAITPKGIALIGGTSPTAALATCYLLTFDNEHPQLTSLPQLPQPIDNAYAAAIGNKVYIAGGNINGTPSRSLFMLNLDSETPQWQKLGDMPGNPRVQPVMASGVNAKGETCLYIFGGFAGRHGKNEPTLELNGLCYTPS